MQNNTGYANLGQGYGSGGAVGAIGSVAVGNPGATVQIEANNVNYPNGAPIGDPNRYGGAIRSGALGNGGLPGVNGLSITGSSITIYSNAADGNGGALDSHNNGDITVTGNLSATYNVAGGSGGFAAVDNVGNLTLSGDSVDLEYNEAGANGGAIFDNDVSGTVSLGAAIVANNVAGTNGGAIYSRGDTTLSDTLLSDNTATAGNGGAVDAEGDFTFTATTANTIGPNKAGGLGGAIYVGGNATLDAAAGGITFSGNTQNTAATAQANAIYLNNTPAITATTLTLNAQGYPITFDDPIQNNPANGLMTVTATGGDSVIFDGASQAGNAANRQSLIDGATEVTKGTTFAVRNNAVYGALAEVTGGTASVFTVDNGATLAGGTTIANGTSAVHADTFTLAGTLDIAGNDTPGTVAGGQASFSQFTVSSSGADDFSGGTVVFNTCLNSGGASTLSDLLVLNGTSGTASATLAAKLVVTNVGGADCSGAQTTDNGILLIQAPNGVQIDAAAFTGSVRAGDWVYTAYKAADGNVYLRSVLAPAPVLVPVSNRAALALLALLIGAVAGGFAPGRKRLWRRG